VAGAVALLLLLAVVWVGVRTLLARGELESAASLGARAQQQLGGGDTAGAAETFERVADHAAAARGLTSDPVFAAASALPLVGPNLAAVGTVAAALDSVAGSAVIPLAGVLGDLDEESLAPAGGRIDLAPIVSAAPVVQDSAAVVRDAGRSVAAIDTDAVLRPVAEAVDRLGGVLEEADGLLATLDGATRLVPAMLGADEQRNYLLIVQNNAEVRATGGLPGAFALVTTADGGFSLTAQASASDFPRYPSPVLPLDRAAESLYGSLSARVMQNINLTPDFPTAARLAQEMWSRERDVRVDGVIAVDPVLLGYVLEATGPVELAGGEVLEADTAVRVLLSEVYARYPDPEVQDVVFADAARSVVEAVSGGSVDPRRLLAALARGADERRILIWNDRDDERAVLDGTVFAGALPADNAEATELGVFLDDATGAKLDYYLDSSASVETETCAGDERTWTATVRLSSRVPADAATSLPQYVTGGRTIEVERGVVRTRVLVYGPVGSRVDSVTDASGDRAAQVEQHLGRAVAQVIVDLAPGQEAELAVVFTGADGPLGPTSVRATPRLDSTTPETTSRICGAAR